MYLDNKYTKWYYSIIKSAKANPFDGYTEKHHIIPKCLGGTDEVDNLVVLSARQHFICHWLLTKMVEGKARYKMVYALNFMMVIENNLQERYKVPPRTYAKLKENWVKVHSKTQKGKKQSPEVIEKRIAPLRGMKRKPFTKEHRENLSKAKTGVPSPLKGIPCGTKGMTYEEIYGEETAKRMKDARSKSSKGRKASKETRLLQSKQRKGKRLGGENTNAKSIVVEGIFYACKKDACEALGISLPTLNKRYL